MKFPSPNGMGVFGRLATEPQHVWLTLNSDTPYAPALLDLSDGPWSSSCRWACSYASQ